MVGVLNPSGCPAVVTPVSGFDLAVVNEPWPFAVARAGEIAAHWAGAQAANPALYDGRILVAPRLSTDGRLRADFVETRFSGLLYWRHLGFPAVGGFNGFGSAVVVARDGAILLGRMAGHTANAGQIYFPAGTPEPKDVRAGRLDLEASILRELAEETGLGPDIVTPSGERWASLDAPLCAGAWRLDVDLSGQELEARVAGFLASDPRPELDGIVLVRSAADIDRARMPGYAVGLLERLLPS